jgi:hypothetical protein
MQIIVRSIFKFLVAVAVAGVAVWHDIGMVATLLRLAQFFSGEKRSYN